MSKEHTVARIKQKGKHFEILVDLQSAMDLRKLNKGSIMEVMQIDRVFTDAKKGLQASSAELETAFGTDDVYAIADKIVKQGEIMLTQEFRDEEREKKLKQIVDYLVINAVDPMSGRPHTAERIKSALDEIHLNIGNKPVEDQVKDIYSDLQKILPIKIQTKRIKIVIPAAYTGKAYGIINAYKEKEEWLSDGSLECILAIPSGALMSFFDKLNGITHGAAITEEIKE
jgi:ribosome maturation protein SDO1